MLKFADMRSLGQRTKSVWPCASRTRCAPTWFRHCLAFLVLTSLVLPELALPEINHLEAAVRLLNQGQIAQAEAEARLALPNPTTRALALSMLGTIRLQQGQFEESANFLNQALGLNPSLAGARTTLGDAYVLQGKPGLAEKCFREVLRLDPRNFNARFGLVKLEASQRHFQQSLEIARPIMSELVKSDEGILVVATAYGALGKKEELKGLVGSWQRLSAPSDEASLDFGDLLLASGMAAEAKAVFEAQETRIAAHPSAALALRLGNSYLSLGDLERAEKNSELALSLAPDCTACYESLAQIAERQQNTEKALSYLVTAKQREPENPEVLFEFGKVCLERNLLDDAVPALEKAVALKPDQDSYVYVLASASVARGNLPKAASLFAQLLQKNPRDAVLNYSIGAVYYLQTKYSEAESSLKRSLAAQPDQVAASYYLALTYDALGDEDQAVPVFRDLLKRHPQHAPSYVKLGGILLRKHQYDEAQQDLERAVSLDPGSVEAHYQLGTLLRRLGKTAEADSQLAESRKLETEQRAQKNVHLRLLLPD
jgi:tetratricopeptide (TPR) repeat protein